MKKVSTKTGKSKNKREQDESREKENARTGTEMTRGEAHNKRNNGR